MFNFDRKEVKKGVRHEPGPEDPKSDRFYNNLKDT
jgi:hypothetical protein